MEFLEKVIHNAEKQYGNKKNKNRLIILLNRYYMAFLSSDDVLYAEKGYFKSEQYLNTNNSDFDILMAMLFFAILLKDDSKINNLEGIVSKYKKYLRNNDTRRYCFYLFLKGLIKIEKGSVRGGNKYIKLLQNTEDKMKNIYLLYLKSSLGEVLENSFYLLQNQEKTSYFKNIILYKILNKNSKIVDIESDVFADYIKWGVYKGIDIKNSIIKYDTKINFTNFDEKFNYRVYIQYNIDFILAKICREYLEANIHNKISYFFFNEAINRQIILDGLNKSYIKACFKNGMEDIGLYPIRVFLQERNIELELMAFIYYIILKDKKYNELVLEQQRNILKCGAYFLEKGLAGRYYYLIYKYMLDFVEVGSEKEKKILNILYPNNFIYEIWVEDNLARYILIKNYELDIMMEYPIVNNKAVVKAISSNFYYYIFSDEKKEIINCKIKINKMVEGTNRKYFYRFYKEGYNDRLTLLNVAKYYLDSNELSTENINLLENILKIENISLNFKMRITMALGNTYFLNGKYEKATYYYKKVMEKYVSDKYVNNIVKCYILCKEYERALDLIKKNVNILNNETLFFSIKEISKEDKYSKEISKFAYELLVRGEIDDIFIDIVIKSYKGGLNEWVKLRKSLEERNILKTQIDEHILRLTIYTQSMNYYSEQIFIELYENDVENPIIEDFLNYCMYEAFNGKYVFSERLVYIFEFIFNEVNYELLGYALAHIYLKNDYDMEQKYNILTKIIENMEINNINFTIFEKQKDKLSNFSYLYKNKPFIYKTLPNRKVYLYYKNVNKKSFYSVEMNYFKFGMYIVTLPIFYGEDIEYYFEENTESGNITTKKFFTTNNKSKIFDLDDEYFMINNAYISVYEGRYNMAHNIIEKLILEEYNLKGKIL